MHYLKTISHWFIIVFKLIYNLNCFWLRQINKKWLWFGSIESCNVKVIRVRICRNLNYIDITVYIESSFFLEKNKTVLFKVSSLLYQNFWTPLTPLFCILLAFSKIISALPLEISHLIRYKLLIYNRPTKSISLILPYCWNSRKLPVRIHTHRRSIFKLFNPADSTYSSHTSWRLTSALIGMWSSIHVELIIRLLANVSSVLGMIMKFFFPSFYTIRSILCLQTFQYLLILVSDMNKMSSSGFTIQRLFNYDLYKDI